MLRYIWFCCLVLLLGCGKDRALSESKQKKRTPLPKANIHILVDGSGSMKGFWQKKGAIDNPLHDLIADIKKKSTSLNMKSEVSFFRSYLQTGEFLQFIPYADWPKPAPDSDKITMQTTWGQNSLLSKAIKKFSKDKKIILVLTDNFQDDSQNKGTIRFYEWLKDNKNVKVAWMLPQSIQFDGNAYIPSTINNLPTTPAALRQGVIKAMNLEPSLASKKLPGTIRQLNNTKEWSIPYRGKRGLALYVMTTDEKYITQIKKLIQSLTASGPKELEALQLRPIGDASIQIAKSSWTNSTYKKKSSANQRCTTDSFPKTANLNLELTKQIDQHHFEAGWKIGAKYDSKQSKTFALHVLLQPSSSYITVQPTTGCKDPIKISGSYQFNIEQHRDLFSQRLQKNTKFNIYAADIGKNQDGEILLTLKVPPLPGPKYRKVQNPPADLAHFLGFDLNLTFIIPHPRLALSKKVEDKFFSKNPLVLDKLYSPKDIIKSITASHAQLQKKISIRPGAISPETPDRISTLTYFLSAGLLVLLFLLWRWLKPLGWTAYIRIEDTDHIIEVSGIWNKYSEDIEYDDDVLGFWRSGVFPAITVYSKQHEESGELKNIGESVTFSTISIRWVEGREN